MRFELLCRNPYDKMGHRKKFMIPTVDNLYGSFPKDLSREHIRTVFQTASFRIERTVSNGQSSPKNFWYDQPQSEWVVLLDGSAMLKFGDGETVSLKKGDYLLIPPHLKHRVDRTSSDAVWLAVHFPQNTPSEPSPP